MGGQRNAASKRKQQGRVNKKQLGKSLVPAGNASSRKDAGLPSFFKHRKQAEAAAAAEARASASDAKGKGRATEDDVMEEAEDAAAAQQPPQSLSEDILQTRDAVQQSEGDSSFTFTAEAGPSNPFSSSAGLDPALTGGRDSSLRAYASQLRKLFATSDILLEVLDARDPLSCRSYATEALALGQGKRVILVLNKIDLVPRENVERWLRYLRHDFPTLAFKASTQMQRKNLAQGAGSVPVGSSTAALTSGSEALGAQALLQLLKNYSRNHQLKSSLTVGVFGAPNVGKSSIINSLKRARVCAVAATPGHTKVLQSVALDKKIRLIDCPGIVFQDSTKDAAAAAGQVMDSRAAALRNVVKVELLQDPVSPITVVLSRVPLAQLETLYQLQPTPLDRDPPPTAPLPAPTLEDVQKFLLRLALRKGRLLAKGGAPDIEGTARSVLHDWNIGKIKYATQPPAVHRSVLNSATASGAVSSAADAPATSGASNATKEQLEKEAAAQAIAATTSIKTSFDPEFDLAGLLGEADAEALTGVGTDTGAPESGMDTSEAPQTTLAGKGSLAESDGKPLLAARARRLPGEEDAQAQADSDAAALADMSKVTASSLGKRRRDANESEDEEDLRQSEPDSDDDDNMLAQRPTRMGEMTEAIPPHKQARVVPDVSMETSTAEAEAADLPSWLERQRSKAATARKGKKDPHSHADSQPKGKMALLSTVFSSTELEGMAVSRGAARKKAKKQKRRAEKHSAGGLTDFVEAGLDLADEPDDGAAMDDGDVVPDSGPKPASAPPAPAASPAMVNIGAGEESEEEL